MPRKKAANDQGEVLYVRSGRDDNRVALHEIDPAHPGGSVIVAGEECRKVGNTALVLDQLRKGELEECDGEADIKAADKHADERVKAFGETGVAQDRPESRSDAYREANPPQGSQPTPEEVAASQEAPRGPTGATGTTGARG